MPEPTRRLAAILAADVVGYSAMVAADETATLARVRALRTGVIEPRAAEHQGRLFKTLGDGFLLEFASAVQALRCAITIQEHLNVQPDGLRLRIGIHQGEVVPEGDDLFGDGVILAARLEPLAEPGGIVISSRVKEDASGKMALETDDLGEPALKNIAAKIRAYRVRLTAAERPALALPDKPSLVVLPFQNMSGDPEQDYFADGMVEDITTALSRIRSLFVIARNSAFTYKGKAVDIRQVGRELGVRYVLEGSVRKAGNRVRITGQLVDAISGAHVWADRFDGALDDVFDLQDRVTASVVAAIEPNLRAAEIERARRKPSESLQAYDLVLRAQYLRQTVVRDAVWEAIGLLRRAIALDPTYALAYSTLTSCHWTMVSQGWMHREDPEVHDMLAACRTALSLAPDDPEVLANAAYIIALPGGDVDGGIALAEKSIAINPNNAMTAYIAGGLYGYASDIATATTYFERAARLNPLHRLIMFYNMRAIAHFAAGEYEATVEWSDKVLREQPTYGISLRYRTAALGLLGRTEEGRDTARRLLTAVPDFTIARARRHIEIDMSNPFRDPKVPEAFYEGLRRCGVPE